jgi:hypothetical protein
MKQYTESKLKLTYSIGLVANDCIWKLLKVNIISGVDTIKLLLPEAFGDSVHNEGLKNGLEDLLIPLRGHEMVTSLGTSVDRCSFNEPRKM